ncbi:hypothetical protein Dimus_021569 [Dionaea muscipula]
MDLHPPPLQLRSQPFLALVIRPLQDRARPVVFRRRNPERVQPLRHRGRHHGRRWPHVGAQVRPVCHFAPPLSRKGGDLRTHHGPVAHGPPVVGGSGFWLRVVVSGPRPFALRLPQLPHLVILPVVDNAAAAAGLRFVIRVAQTRRAELRTQRHALHRPIMDGDSDVQDPLRAARWSPDLERDETGGEFLVGHQAADEDPNRPDNDVP